MSDDSIDFEGIGGVDWCGVITAQTSHLGFNDVNNSRCYQAETLSKN